DENVNNKFLEDIYDARQILLKSIAKKVNQDNIQETWQIIDKWLANNKYKHFIIVIDLISYLCTCMSNISWEVNHQQNTVFINEHASQAQHSTVTQIVPQLLTIPPLVIVNNWHAVAQQLKYNEDDKEKMFAVANLLVNRHKAKLLNSQELK
ncbi:27130_t:CDS:2, partial [Gigaspora margarita]